MLLLSVLVSSCCKDPSLTRESCNGGMAPDLITFEETECTKADHIWQITYGGGNVDLPATPGPRTFTDTFFMAEVNYTVRVDTDNDASTSQTFSLENYPEGESAVSFFDADANIWTIVLGTDCPIPVHVQQLPQPCGGIDILDANKAICYTVLDELIFGAPNGFGLVTLPSSNYNLIDIAIDNQTNDIYLAVESKFGGWFGVVRGNAAQLGANLQTGEFSEIFFAPEDIQQVAFDDNGQNLFYTNSTSGVFFQEAEDDSNARKMSFGNSEAKTALVFDRANNQLYLARGSDNCSIDVIDPVTEQVISTFDISGCSGSIHALDLDEQERRLVFSDDANLWLIALDDPAAGATNLITNFNNTLKLNNAPHPQNIKVPIGDVVLANYN